MTDKTGDCRAALPVGIFDSGMGGLTVLAALLKRLPREAYHYLGDTARLPYGTKSRGTILRYSLQTTEKLVERGIKLLVVACNTATAAALPELQKAYAPLPVIGVVEPGAAAACKALSGSGRGGTIMVLATESTIKGGAYARAIKARRPEAEVLGVPCTLFVPLAEEGWMDGDIARAIARRYLAPYLASGSKPDCMVLGCTHFPPLAPAIAAVAGREVIMVDSAATTAEAVEQELTRLAMLRPAASPDGELHFLTTDAPDRFARVGGLFLNREICADDIELVVL
ncbi:glutamate racemase [Desulfovibrio sp. OttesenSCG-928-F20]|nr:glutamate racemase [Desulfovibrio sp. OttesenSCG-928-F20]